MNGEFGGIDKMNPQQARISWFKNNKYALNSNSVVTIYEDSRNNLFFATDSGLNALGNKNGQVQSLQA